MRRLYTFLICCIIVGVGGYTAYRSYKVWKQKHLLTMARQFIERSDDRNALLCLQLALAGNPVNVEACRMAAQVLQSENSPETLAWRQRVVELDPKSTEDRMELAETAGAMRAFAIASNALAGIAPEAKKTASYHNVAGSVASADSRFEEAKGEFGEAIRQEPNNPRFQFNLALVELKDPKTLDKDPARAALQRLAASATDSRLRCQALRELIQDATTDKRDSAALAFSEELAKEPGAMFADQLTHLSLLEASQSPGLKSVVVSLEHRAATNVADVGQLAVWEQNHNRTKEGLAWLRSLPDGIQTNQPVAQLIGEYYMAMGDWTNLQKTLEHEQWKESDFARHAFLARAYRCQQLSESGKSEWQQATALARGRPPAERMLISVASRWGWRSDLEELLWTFINEYPDELWASRDLTGIFFSQGQTRSLLKLFQQLARSRPTDLMIKNNLAITALLLKADDLKPLDLAREVYEKDPANSHYAVTYAFSLMLQKKNAEALKVMDRVNPTDLEDPSICGYYGLVLQANGDTAKARKYLKLAEKGSHLPEETKLFDLARSRA